MLKSIKLTIKEVAELYGKTERAVQKDREAGRIRAIAQNGATGYGGITYLILLDSLPPDIQAKYLSQQTNLESEKKAKNERKEEYGELSDLEIIWGTDYEKQLEKALQKVECVDLLKNGNKAQINEKLNEYGYNGNIREVYRWQKRLLENNRNIGALFPPKRADKGSRRGLAEEAIKFIEDMYLHEFQPTVTQVYEAYIKKCEETGWKIISVDTARRIINQLNEGEKVFAREGEWAYNAKIAPKIKRDYSQESPNSVWCGDGHTLDFFVNTDDGEQKRYTLSMWMDMFSKSIVGHYFGVHSNSYVIGRALYNGIHGTEEIFGVPAALYMDNGKDYKSNKIKVLCASLGIEARNALPYSAWSKPIERLFKTFTDRFSKLGVGYCGSDNKKRPDSFNKVFIFNSGVTIEHVKILITDWVNWYNNKKHSALNGKTPLQTYLSKSKVNYIVPHESVTEYLIFDKFERKITQQGFKYNKNLYCDEKLFRYVGKTAEIKINPEEPELLSVFVDQEFVCVAGTKTLTTMSLDDENISMQMKEKAEVKKPVKERLDARSMTEAEAKANIARTFSDNEEAIEAFTGLKAEKDKRSKVVKVDKFTKEAAKARKATESKVESDKEDSQKKSEMLINDYKKYFKS